MMQLKKAAQSKRKKDAPQKHDPDDIEKPMETEKFGSFEKQDIQALELEILEEHGLGADEIQKMQQSGIWTVQGLSYTTNRRLLSIKGFTDIKIKKIQEALKKVCPTSFITGLQVYEKQKKKVQITTGSKGIDEILGGGIHCEQITVVYGCSGTGKTTLAHTLAVTSNLPYEHCGAEGQVLYIDTKGGFNGDKIAKIAERFGLDAMETLSRITVVQPLNTDQLLQILSEVRQRFLARKHSLLIVDSITNMYRTDYCGRGELADRQMHLNQVLRELAKIAYEFKVAVFLTNEMTALVDGGIFDHRKAIPIGGNILQFAADWICYLRGTPKNRIFRVEKSPNIPEQDSQFAIYDGGIADPSAVPAS